MFGQSNIAWILLMKLLIYIKIKAVRAKNTYPTESISAWVTFFSSFDYLMENK